MATDLSPSMRDALLAALPNARPGLRFINRKTIAALQSRGFLTESLKLTSIGRATALRLRRETEAGEPMLAAMRGAFAARPSAPVPREPTPLELAAKAESEAQVVRLNTLLDIFQPRQVWASPSIDDTRLQLKLLVLLDLLQQANEVQVSTTDIPSLSLEKSKWLERKFRFNYSNPDYVAYNQCSYRRGNQDLKDQSWSAYRHLRRTSLGQTLERTRDLPLSWYAAESRIAVTAGNVDLDRVMQQVRALSLTEFCVVGERYDGEGGFGWIRRGAPFVLTRMKFSQVARNALDELYEKQFEELRRQMNAFEIRSVGSGFC